MTGKVPLMAERFDSSFLLAHDSYNCITAAADGRIYYVLASADAVQGGKAFRFDMADQSILELGDLTSCCGESNLKVIAQGKSHDGFYAYGEELFFSTHIGYYEAIDGMERLPATPVTNGGLYPGGHLLSVNPSTSKITDHLCIPDEGILAMAMDQNRGIVYLLSWPTGLLYVFNIQENLLSLAGPVSGIGEAGMPGKDYRVLCRSLLVEPVSGKLYGSTATGQLFHYSPDEGKLNVSSNFPLRKDYFGQYAIDEPGTMAYNWRKIIWNKKEACAYGIHGNSGYLFKLDPATEKIELLDRLCSAPSQKSGMFDLFSYGYLGLTLDNETQVLYYLCGGPIDNQQQEALLPLAKGGARGLENLHLVTYSIPDQQYHDHGAVFYENGEIPTYVNSIALGKDGYIYSLARMNQNGKERTDLIRIPVPQHV